MNNMVHTQNFSGRDQSKNHQVLPIQQCHLPHFYIYVSCHISYVLHSPCYAPSVCPANVSSWHLLVQPLLHQQYMQYSSAAVHAMNTGNSGIKCIAYNLLAPRGALHIMVTLSATTGHRRNSLFTQSSATMSQKSQLYICEINCIYVKLTQLTQPMHISNLSEITHVPKGH